MKTILDPSFEYTNSDNTDLRKRFKQAEREHMLSILVEVSDLLDNYSDVIDGEWGPKPNQAMNLKRDLDNVIAKLKEQA